jgi:hypothetical protein
MERSTIVRRVRQLLLGSSGLTFAVIAVMALAAPRAVAERYGMRLDDHASFNEFRAVFVGFWSGLAVLLFTAVRRTDLPILGNLAATLIGLQAIGRAASFVLDGTTEWRFVSAFLLEIATSLGILLLSPRAKS